MVLIILYENYSIFFLMICMFLTEILLFPNADLFGFKSVFIVIIKEKCQALKLTNYLTD
jgi:hypothetical protein